MQPILGEGFVSLYETGHRVRAADPRINEINFISSSELADLEHWLLFSRQTRVPRVLDCPVDRRYE